MVSDSLSNTGFQAIVEQARALLIALTEGGIERGLIACVLLAPRCHVKEAPLVPGIPTVTVGIVRKLSDLLTDEYIGRGVIVLLTHKEKSDRMSADVTVLSSGGCIGNCIWHHGIVCCHHVGFSCMGPS